MTAPSGLNAFKIAFIGSHGVGKTTLCYGLAARLKTLDISLDVVNEVARRCPLPINRETTFAAQAWILHTQIAEEVVAASRYDLVICDRSVLDNFVYLLLASREPRGRPSPYRRQRHTPRARHQEAHARTHAQQHPTTPTGKQRREQAAQEERAHHEPCLAMNNTQRKPDGRIVSPIGRCGDEEGGEEV